MRSTTRLTPKKTGHSLTSAPTRGPNGNLQRSSAASTLVNPPLPPAAHGEKAAKSLKRHEFPDGGGSGGAEAFRRGKRPIPKPR